mmetsp:Transcript_12185/g.19810  ORF Transcript_12185/g.19810 Transcript_12185/m.19810 type:complete len:252 (-) Transcript_12185:175-930(-)
MKVEDVVSGPGGLLTSLCLFLLFWALHSRVLWFTRCCAPVLSANLAKRGKLNEWKNISVSFLFVCLCSLALVYIVACEGTHQLGDIMEVDSWRCRLLLCVANAYFAADTLDMALDGNFPLHLRYHHGIILVAFSTAIYYNVYAGYLVGTLIAETNTVFLHSRKLLQLAGVSRQTVKYRCIVAILLLLFPFQRVIPHLWLLQNVYKDFNRFEYKWHFALAFGGLSVVSFLNFLLLRDILVSEFRPRKKRPNK